MKTIIAGGRNYTLTQDDFRKLDTLDITEVVSGEARGVDKCGEYYAESRGYPLTCFPANWELHGKMFAGRIRNRKMAKYADAVVLFFGGKGTDDMRKVAIERGLKVYEAQDL